MNPETKKFIEQHIQKILDEFDFENQKKDSDKCVCFRGDKCHAIENLNCFLCYCPEYDNNAEEGGCKINSVKGKWFEEGGKRVWDCSDCDYPHKREVAEKYLKRLFSVD